MTPGVSHATPPTGIGWHVVPSARAFWGPHRRGPRVAPIDLQAALTEALRLYLAKPTRLPLVILRGAEVSLVELCNLAMTSVSVMPHDLCNLIAQLDTISPDRWLRPGRTFAQGASFIRAAIL